MGNSLSVAVGYLIIFYLQLKDKFNTVFGKQDEKNFYTNDIILKDDDEHKAGIAIISYFNHYRHLLFR